MQAGTHSGDEGGTSPAVTAAAPFGQRGRRHREGQRVHHDGQRRTTGTGGATTTTAGGGATGAGGATSTGQGGFIGTGAVPLVPEFTDDFEDGSFTAPPVKWLSTAYNLDPSSYSWSVATDAHQGGQPIVRLR